MPKKIFGMLLLNTEFGSVMLNLDEEIKFVHTHSQAGTHTYILFHITFVGSLASNAYLTKQHRFFV